jgi:CheY-like chemotaxis protein
MTILFADDDAEDRSIFLEAVRETFPRATFISATNGEEVIAILKKGGKLPDYIFLDINMPLMGGVECLTLLKSHREFKNLDVIVYSTTTNEKEISTVIRLGARFMLKQVDYKKLVQELAAVLSAKEIIN